MPDPNENLIDLPSEGPAVEVEVTGPPIASIEQGGSEEHEDYSQKVQKRIDKLTRKVREAERQQNAALQYAQGIQKENVALRGRVQDLDTGYVSEYGDRIASESAGLEKQLETAIVTNDTSGQVELNKKLAQLAIEEERVKAAKLEQNRLYAAQEQQASLTPATPAPQSPTKPDPKAEKWAARNNWFGEDDAMTFAAFGIHKTLVDQEGFDTNSPEYYDEIDRRMQDAFPHKFNGQVGSGEIVSVSDSRRPQQAVASAVRSSNYGRKSVRLSPSEVAIAKKLGVPLNEYARHKHT
jgi:hypothetical protein